MDEILQRMLAVEKQAETILRDAGKEAETLLATTRRATAAEEERLRREAGSAAAVLIQSRIKAAETRKAAALAATGSTLITIEQGLRKTRAAAVAMVFQELAFPQNRPETAADKP